MYSFKFDSDWTNKVTIDTQEKNDIKYILDELQKISGEEVVDKESDVLGEKLSTVTEKENKVKSLIEVLNYELEGMQAYIQEAIVNFDLVKANEAQENVCVLDAKISEQKANLDKILEEKQVIEKEFDDQKRQKACYIAYSRVKEIFEELPNERVSKILAHEDQLTPFLGSYYTTLKGEILDDYGENS